MFFRLPCSGLDLEASPDFVWGQIINHVLYFETTNHNVGNVICTACFLHLEEHFHPCLLRQKDYLMRSKVYVILAYFPPSPFFAYRPIIDCGKSIIYVRYCMMCCAWSSYFLGLDDDCLRALESKKESSSFM